MKYRTTLALAAMVALTGGSASAARAGGDAARVRTIVDAAVAPIMKERNIPGMAVAVTARGKRYVFNYGVASRETGKPVTSSTLFEIGSISKAFTVTLASYARENGRLSWPDTTSRFLPGLEGTAFGDVRLRDLATHTAGGFPLQLPDEVTNDEQLTAYLREWKPADREGTVRKYANPSIGMLGRIAARSMDGDYATLMEREVFRALGLSHTYLHVPESKAKDYAQGYTKADAPARLTEAVLSSEAYGVRSTAADMLRFVEANMGMVKAAPKLRRAITATHTGYFQAGVMTQDLIWEQYAWPVGLETLLRGNSPEMAYNPTPVEALVPPQPPRGDVWINKTGSTNGFGAYVAFIPQKRLGIVLLANKNYPNDDRATMAHQILTQLADKHHMNK
jgi:beta-lactamase class C